MRILFFVLAALLVGCGGGGGGSEPIAQETPPVTVEAPKRAPECTVDFYGDSILAGTYLLDMGLETPAQMLHRMRPAWTVRDMAKGGEKAEDRAKVFDGGASRASVIEHGANDGGAYFRGEPHGDYEQAMRSMIRQAKAAGRTVIVTGLSQHTYPLDWVNLYHELARRAAVAEGVTFADWLTVPHKGAGEMWDETHPGDVFTERLVVRIIEHLDRLAPECAP